MTPTPPWRLIKVKPLKHYKLEVEFIDGTQGIVEMEQLISRDKAGVFVALRDPDIFNQATSNMALLPGRGKLTFPQMRCMMKLSNMGNGF